MRRIDRDRIGRTGERDQAGAHAQRRARRHPRGPRAMRRAREHQRRAAGIFVRAGLEPGKAPRHIAGALRKVRGAIAVSAAASMPMSASARRPQCSRARKQEMARLQAKETDARGRADRGAANGAGFAVNSGRNVDAEHRPSARGEIVDPLHAFASQPVDVAGKPGAVERIDHQVRAVRIERLGGPRPPAVALGRQRGIAAQRLARAEQEKLDAIAAPRQAAARR